MIKWLLGFLFFALLLSQSAVDFVSVLLSFAVVYQLWLDRNQASSLRLFPKIGVGKLFLLWFGIVAIGFLFNAGTESNWTQRFLEFRWLLFFYVVVYAFRRVKPNERIIPWVCMLLIFTSLYTICSAFYMYDAVRMLPLPPASAGATFARSGGVYSNPMIMAHVYGLFFSILFACGVFYVGSKRKKGFLLSTTILFLAAALFLTFTRGIWLALFPSILLSVFFFSRRLAIVAFVALTTLTAGLYQFWPTFRDRAQYAFSDGSYDQKRWHLWQANWEIFKEHPILGVGYGENTKLLPSYYEKLGISDQIMTSHAHNQYLHLLAGTGILGLAIYFSILFYFFWLGARAVQATPKEHVWHKSLLIGCLSAQLTFILGGLFEANLEHALVKFAITFVWAITVWLAYENKVLMD